MDGSATITTIGGQSPYTYEWVDGSTNTSISNVGAGDYNFTVSDVSGCSVTGVAQITDPNPVILADANVTPVSCVNGNDGQVTAVPGGGTGPYTYAWTGFPAVTGPTLTDLAIGDYEVVITDGNGCVSVPFTVTMTEPLDPVSVSLIGLSPTCGQSDGSVSALASGGTTDYTYLWSNGSMDQSIDQIPAGMYSVTVTDGNGCSATDMIDLADFTVNIEFTSEMPNCSGEASGSITIDTTFGGVAPYLYSLNGADFTTSTSFTNLSPGVYPVVVRDSLGCELQQDIVVQDKDEVIVTLGVDQQIELGESVELSAQSNVLLENLTFNWAPSTSLSCLDCPNPEARPFEDELFQLIVTDQDGCQGSDEILIEVEVKYDVFIPNAFTPNNDGVNDIFTIYTGISATQILRLVVFDRWGELVWDVSNVPPNESIFGWNGTLNGKNLNPGVFVYYAEIEFVDGTVIPFKGDVTLLK